MLTLYLVLLRRGPSWTAGDSPELDRLQAAHLAHIQKMREAGYLLAAGPCADDGNLRGVLIMSVASIETAEQLVLADPSVLAGRLRPELHPWLVPAGSLDIQA